MSSNNHSDAPHDTLWHLIKQTRFCMLTHRDADGQLHSQPLTLQNRTFGQGEPLYFFIGRDSHVFARVATDAQVNAAFVEPDDSRYVSVSGRATISEDKALKAELWSRAASAWFPGGLDDPNLALLSVQPDHAEYWNVKECKLLQVIKVAAAAVSGKPPDLGEHAEVDRP